MSTRGALGYRANEKDYIFYHSSDSYLESLGVQLINDFLKHPINKNDFLKLNLVEDEYTDEALDYGYPSTIHSLIENNSTYFSFESFSNFIYESLYCEYAYIFNLDTEELEFYAGFNSVDKPYLFGRYAVDFSEKEGKYLPCYLIYTLKFSDLKDFDINNVINIKNQLEQKYLIKIFENI